MGDEIRASAEALRVMLEFLNAGYGTTLVLLLVIGVGLWMRRHDLNVLNKQIKQCRDQHQECEEKAKRLTFAVWSFLQGDEESAKRAIGDQLQ